MALASGGSVARFFNVVETAGNVFEIWDKVPADQPIKVANNCRRHFISVEESVGLIIFALTAKPGRYAVNSPEKLSMEEIAERLYPNRKKEKMKPRTGDRLIEIFKSTSEECNLIFNESILNVVSVHDN
jgi:nucleoside-diphosphate-sugar epimerase